MNIDDLVKSHQDDGFVKSSRCQASKNWGVKRPYQVSGNDEVEAQRRRWTFYETINIRPEQITPGGGINGQESHP